MFHFVKKYKIINFEYRYMDLDMCIIILLKLCYYSIDFVYLMFIIESNMFFLILFDVYAFILLCSPFVRDVLYNICFLLKPMILL
jgi:hypothetical protein